jgi:hypothetical protein
VEDTVGKAVPQVSLIYSFAQATIEARRSDKIMESAAAHLEQSAKLAEAAEQIASDPEAAKAIFGSVEMAESFAAAGKPIGVVQAAAKAYSKMEDGKQVEAWSAIAKGMGTALEAAEPLFKEEYKGVVVKHASALGTAAAIADAASNAVEGGEKVMDAAEQFKTTDENAQHWRERINEMIEQVKERRKQLIDRAPH